MCLLVCLSNGAAVEEAGPAYRACIVTCDTKPDDLQCSELSWQERGRKSSKQSCIPLTIAFGKHVSLTSDSSEGVCSVITGCMLQVATRCSALSEQ